MNGLSEARLGTVMARIETDFNRSLSVSELAQLAHLSQFHFARMFRRQVGTSPHAYIVGKRMDRAKQLLAHTDVPIKEIATNIGYSAHAHFTSTFRRHCGTTPAAFRRLVRRQSPLFAPAEATGHSEASRAPGAVSPPPP